MFMQNCILGKQNIISIYDRDYTPFIIMYSNILIIFCIYRIVIKINKVVELVRVDYGSYCIKYKKGR